MISLLSQLNGIDVHVGQGEDSDSVRIVKATVTIKLYYLA